MVGRAAGVCDDLYPLLPRGKLRPGHGAGKAAALFESFLAGTSNHSFIWVYKWWGVLPVFITTYVPFFLAANYVPDMEAKKRTRFLAVLWGTVALCLIVLIPAGVI